MADAVKSVMAKTNQSAGLMSDWRKQTVGRSGTLAGGLALTVNRICKPTRRLWPFRTDRLVYAPTARHTSSSANGVFWHLRFRATIFIAMSDVTQILSQIEQGDPQ